MAHEYVLRTCLKDKMLYQTIKMAILYNFIYNLTIYLQHKYIYTG